MVSFGAKVMFACGAFAISGLMMFAAIATCVNTGAHFRSDTDPNNLTAAMFDPDAMLDPSYMGGTSMDFIITTYFPNSPHDPMGGNDTCADGTRFSRDPNIPEDRNLFANTPDGRVVQGVVATVQDAHKPVLPWTMKDKIKLAVPAYNDSAEIHDHFAACVTDPRRLDLAMSGPAQANKFFADLKTACPGAKPYRDPGGSPYNGGTLLPVVVMADMPVDSFGDLSAKRQELLSVALAQLGKPYVSGGAGPNVFDCSGLILYCYERIRNSKPTYHHTDEQAAEGKIISASEALPGDCIYFGVPGNLGHVGMYIGGGQFIHAPHTGDFVKITALSSYRSRPIGCYVRFLDPDKDISPRGDRLDRSRAFMRKNNFDPALAALAQEDCDAADRYGMDFRMALVCALVESSGGKHNFRPNNPFGLGGSGYTSYREAIDAYYRTIDGYGLGTSAYQIFRKYRGADNGYAERCLQVLISI